MWIPMMQPPKYWTPGWAGPVYVGRDLRTVRGTFRVPTPQKNAPNNAQMDVWAGLGGLNQPTNLCQVGVTLQQTTTGLRGYLFAWDYPQTGHEVLGVQPGDVIAVTAGWLGTHWGATATDRRTGQTVTIGCAAPFGGGWRHAEWITETHAWNSKAPALATTPVWFHWMAATGRGRGSWMQAWELGAVTRFMQPETAVIRLQ